MTRPASADLGAPDPPRRFRGAFRSDPDARRGMAGASGPFSIVPRAVAAPRDAEDVAALVAWARTEGIPLVPRGAGTGMPGGNVGSGVAVDLSGLAEVGFVDPETGLVEAAPGATGADLQRAAQAVGRFFPALPSSAERCTVGGMVANNAAGARSLRYGSVHAWVEGLEAVLADGTLVRLEAGAGQPAAGFAALRDELRGRIPAPAFPWPAVRKNSSGYALDRFLPTGDPVQLLVGSEGTLAVLTRLWLRTEPLPTARALALVPVPDTDAVDPLTAHLTEAGASACEFFGDRFLTLSGLRASPEVGALVGKHAALLLVEVEGDEAGVEEGLGRVLRAAADMGVDALAGRSREECDRLWQVRHAASPVVAAQAERGLVSMQFIEDSVVPPGHLARYLHGLDAILADEGTDAVVFGHAGDGNVHVNPLVDVLRPDWRERVRRILERTVTLVAGLGGTLSGEHGDGRLRAPFHERIFGPAADAAFRLVKETLDPDRILNPGVVVAGDGQDPLEGLTPDRRIG